MLESARLVPLVAVLALLYADKINRGHSRTDLYNPEILHDKVEASLRQKNQMLVKIYNQRAIDVEETVAFLTKMGEKIRKCVDNTGLLLNKAIDRGARKRRIHSHGNTSR